MRRNHHKVFFIIVPVLLLAAFLRIYHLDTIPNGFLPGEAMRGYDAYSLGHTGADSFGVHFPLFLRGFDDYVAALYSYVAAPLVYFGLSVFSLRLTSALLGILTVAVAFQIIRRPFGNTAAIAGSCLLAVSSWHIIVSRTGFEWSIFVLGTTLSIALLYRGLRRPPYLIAGGLVAGLSLYSYSTVKAFLPLLLIGFVIFYWRELLRQKKFALLALLIFVLCAIPVYTFSLTPEGMLRFQNVSQGRDSSLVEVVPQLIANYFSYFSPDFLFAINYETIVGRPAIANGRLRAVGVLFWFELPLILLALAQIFSHRSKNKWFILYWLLVAPIGINLHRGSPSPHLWLTAIPVPQALAGTGFGWLLSLAKQSLPKLSHPRVVRWGASGFLGVFTLGILIQFGFMVYDLFYQFPVYGAGAWFYGRGPSVVAMESIKNQYDNVILAAEDLTSSVYLLFFTQYDPARRHAELAAAPEKTWQNMDDYKIGNARHYIQEPGCHLILTSIADAADLKAQFPYLVTLQRFDLPDGKPQYGLYAFPSPSANVVESGSVFDDEILLQGFALVSPPATDNKLRPGQAICLVVQWQALQNITTDYTVFVHLTGSFNPATDSPLWGQHDSPPVYGDRATSTWQPGDIIQDPHILSTPPDMPPGHYSLEIGLYDSSTGERVPVRLKGDDDLKYEVTLMELDIE